MGVREQVQRIRASAADVGDSLKALELATSSIDRINLALGSDPLRVVRASLHKEYARLVEVSERLTDAARGIEMPAEMLGPYVPCRLITRNGSPLTTVDLPIPRVGDFIRLRKSRAFLVTQVFHEHGAEYQAVIVVEPIGKLPVDEEAVS